MIIERIPASRRKPGQDSWPVARPATAATAAR
jgi:hypothetical protein